MLKRRVSVFSALMAYAATTKIEDITNKVDADDHCNGLHQMATGNCYAAFYVKNKAGGKTSRTRWRRVIR